MFLADEETGRSFADVMLRVGGRGEEGEGEVVLAHKQSLWPGVLSLRPFSVPSWPENLEVRSRLGRLYPVSQPSWPSSSTPTAERISILPDDALYIFSAPNFFGFTNTRLHRHCKAVLEQDIDPSNVLKILETADTINLQVMKKHCLEMIAAHFPSIVRQKCFRSLRRELLLDIFDVLASRMVE